MKWTTSHVAISLLAVSLQLLAGPLSLSAGPSPDTAEDFASLCADRAAVERVYEAHRAGAKPPVDQALFAELIKRLVQEDLRKEAMLKEAGGAEMTAERLEAEVRRIDLTTRAPEVLAELKAALGNDPARFARTVARPILVERELRGGSAAIPGVEEVGGLGPEKELGDAWQPFGGPTPRKKHTAVWTGSEMIIWGGHHGTVFFNNGWRYNPAANSWTPMTTASAPAGRRDHTAVWTGSQMIIWGGLDGGGNYLSSGGRYDPVANTWTNTAASGAPAGRISHTAVWAGGRMVIWGGANASSYLTDGSCYNPAANSWKAMGTSGAPDGRVGHTAVAVGGIMVVWGGYNGSYLNSGAYFDVSGNGWAALPTSGAPAARYGHTAVWAGGKMLVWGGYAGGDCFNSGARYDLTNGYWTEMSINNAPDGRISHTAVWSGGEMLIWGGYKTIPYAQPYLYQETLGRYNPQTDQWTTTMPAGAPSAREEHTAVWTGSEMVVWGGYDRARFFFNDGGRFNPAANRWTAVASSDAPVARRRHTAVWTGSEMIVWGGYNDAYLTNGGRYNPTVNSWTAVTTTNAPSGCSGHSAVWTGGEMIVWGGTPSGASYVNGGGRYDPLSDSWTSVTQTGAPAARSGHSAVWTGKSMIIWGGYNGNYLASGACYNPTSNSWKTVSTTNVPAGRFSHTAVWTGSNMIVWGGNNGSYLTSGGRYNPDADSWVSVATASAPKGRAGHTAVWTGAEMLVWGGSYDEGIMNSGGRYDPSFNSWTAMTASSAPAARTGHTALWTGDEMIVWGGAYNSGASDYTWTLLSSGGRYRPSSNSWTATLTTGAPLARTGHSAVWTDREMIVWGGFMSNNATQTYLNDGAHFYPATGLRQYGWLQVSLSPTGALTAGAQWKIDDGEWLYNGTIVPGLDAGSHTLSFKTVTGWFTPADQTITIASGVTNTVVGAYTEETRIISLLGSLAFGKVEVGAAAERTLSITNSGTSTLNISAIKYPSGFSGNWPDGTIEPRGAHDVTVTFAPVSAVSYSGKITVTSDATRGTNTIAISGAGTALPGTNCTIRLSVSPTNGGTVSGGGAYKAGSSRTVKAVAKTGFVFANWTEQGNVASSAATYTFLLVRNHDLVANFTDNQAPTLALQYPAANARVLTNNHGSVTVKGTAKDNQGVAEVLCQINTEAWAGAATLNGWTNWSASVAMRPGTNVLRAYARDVAGRCSKTNTVTFQYVLTSPLDLRMVGKGSVSGATNRQPLEINRNYTLTATAGTGFVFTNWSGEVTGRTTRLSFAMRSNLLVTANFVDIQAPTLTLQYPTANARILTNNHGSVTVKGTAKDNQGVAEVLYQINTEAWAGAATLNGWTNWSAAVAMRPGTNVLRTYARDLAGRCSKTNAVTFQYVLTSPLDLRLVGKGTVSGATNRQPLELNRNYTLTATAGAGFVFTNWSGDVTGRTTRLSFAMRSNLLVVANFVDIQVPTLTLQYPTANARVLTNDHGAVTVKGTAKDNYGVAEVLCQVNTEAWAGAATLNGWTNWSASVAMRPGTNVLRTYARDLAGRCSKTNTVTFQYSVKSGLELQVAGFMEGAVEKTGAGFSEASQERELLVIIDVTGLSADEPVIIEGSADLLHWQPVYTNTVSGDKLQFSVPVTGNTLQFFRAKQ